MSAELVTAVQTACDRFASRIVDPCKGIIIPDTDEELNWHAFLAHSLDMQGFRADWFVGRWPNAQWSDFRTLHQRGLGVAELASLWEIEPIRRALEHPSEAGLKMSASSRTMVVTASAAMTAELRLIVCSRSWVSSWMPQIGFGTLRALLMSIIVIILAY